MEISVLGNMNFKGKFSVSKLDAFPATASAGELVVVQDRLWHNQEIAPNRLAWVPLTEDKTYHIHNQPDLSAQWIVTHNFGILGDIDLSVYDNAGKPISYANLVVVSENQVAVNFTEPKLGTAVMYVSERIAAKLIAANSVKIGDLLVREQDMKLLIGGTEASLKGHTHEMSEINGLMTEINLLKSSAGLSPNPSLNSLTVTNDIKVWQGQNGGWRDIISEVNARASGSNSPTFTRLGTSPFYAYKFAVDTECWMNFHLNHDYAPGTAVFPHVHYTTDGTATIPIRWEFAIAVAKGHGQEAFNVPTPIIITVDSVPIASAWSHMVAEIAMFTDEIFSREEIEAIKAHEEGHIVHGHIDALLAETDLEAVGKDDGIRLVMERELEADAYAAEKVGAAHMLSALRKFPGALASFMVREGSALTHEELTAIYRDRLTTTHAPRLAALERMAAEAK